jgi:16S rRNA (guanine966-N2)-methyltransferase
MIRVTTGKAKNKRLTVPEVPGIRAVQEVVKLAIFAILGEKVENSRCLDIYAGSGNLGIEALSRGAAWCDFVDENWDAKQAIIGNIENCGFLEQAEVHHSDSVKYAANTSEKYDLIFSDPFYEDTSHIFLMKNLEEILNKEGRIIFLHGKNLDMNKIIKDTKLEIETERRYGSTILTILKHS